jgi:hypothetical protein
MAALGAHHAGDVMGNATKTCTPTMALKTTATKESTHSSLSAAFELLQRRPCMYPQVGIPFDLCGHG